MFIHVTEEAVKHEKSLLTLIRRLFKTSAQMMIHLLNYLRFPFAASNGVGTKNVNDPDD